MKGFTITNLLAALAVPAIVAARPAADAYGQVEKRALVVELTTEYVYEIEEATTTEFYTGTALPTRWRASFGGDFDTSTTVTSTTTFSVTSTKAIPTTTSTKPTLVSIQTAPVSPAPIIAAQLSPSTFATAPATQAAPAAAVAAPVPTVAKYVNTYTGDMTYYETGLGACGWTNLDSDMVIALAHGMMGTQSNGNPYCGRMVSITYGGKTITAKVVDKCMGCAEDDIDLSHAAFAALVPQYGTPQDPGRVVCQWGFIS
jgi:hypothetical protein